VNQMWFLKNSKDLLEYIKSRSLSSCNNIKTCDFSTHYTKNKKINQLVFFFIYEKKEII